MKALRNFEFLFNIEHFWIFNIITVKDDKIFNFIIINEIKRLNDVVINQIQWNIVKNNKSIMKREFYAFYCIEIADDLVELELWKINVVNHFNELIDITLLKMTYSLM